MLFIANYRRSLAFAPYDTLFPLSISPPRTGAGGLGGWLVTRIPTSGYVFLWDWLVIKVVCGGESAVLWVRVECVCPLQLTAPMGSSLAGFTSGHSQTVKCGGRYRRMWEL